MADPRLGLQQDAFARLCLKDRDEEISRRWIFKNGLQVMGPFKIPKGAAANYVLTSDAYGVGTWQSAASLSTGALADYWYKPGISAAFTAYMRTTSAGIGYVSSTAHATKGKMNFGVSGAERMTIDEAAGSVGINTTTPGATLHIVGNAAAGSVLVPTSTTAVNWDGPRDAASALTGNPLHTGVAVNNDDTEWDGVNPASLGTNPQQFGFSTSLTPGRIWTVTLRLRTDSGTANVAASSYADFILFDASGNQFTYGAGSGPGGTLSLDGLTTSWTTYTITLDCTGAPVGTGTANTIKCGLITTQSPATTLYTRCTYIALQSNAGAIARWDLNGGTQSGQIDSSGLTGIGTGSSSLAAVLTLKGISSNDLQRWVTSGGTQVGSITSSGVVNFTISGNQFSHFSTGTEVSGFLNVGVVTGAGLGAQATIHSSISASTPTLRLLGNSGGQTGNFLDVVSYPSTKLMSISSTGQLLMGNSAGTSYYIIEPGDDFLVTDNAALNLIKVQDRNTWTAPAVDGWHIQVGDAVTSVRNLVFGGSGATGSNFDRLGFQSLHTLFRSGLHGSFPSTIAGLVEMHNTTNIANLVLRANASQTARFLDMQDSNGATQAGLRIDPDLATVPYPGVRTNGMWVFDNPQAHAIATLSAANMLVDATTDPPYHWLTIFNSSFDIMRVALDGAIVADAILNFPAAGGDVVTTFAAQELFDKTLDTTCILQVTSPGIGVHFRDTTTSTKRLYFTTRDAVGSNQVDVGTSAARTITMPDYTGVLVIRTAQYNSAANETASIGSTTLFTPPTFSISCTTDGTTNLTSTAAFRLISVGTRITGADIPANTFASVVSASSITMTNAATGSSTATRTFEPPATFVASVVLTCVVAEAGTGNVTCTLAWTDDNGAQSKVVASRALTTTGYSTDGGFVFRARSTAAVSFSTTYTPTAGGTTEAYRLNLRVNAL